MSKSYDDRIVRMGFDNAKFEKNASQTMSTLDKLNEKLKLKGASDGSQNLQRSMDSLDFSSIEKAITNIENRFSTMGIVGMNVINKITDGIAGSVKQLEAATIGQIKSGGWSRAMNIANAQFQIEGLGFAWEEVEKAVSYGVKDTAYGLDAAASAASQLAASGVDFKKTLDTVNGQDLTAMHKSLRAISGVAAMTNSSYEDIARIFTTVAGNGRLMGDQLLQLSSRGMNAAAKLAEVMGTTEEEVRDMVSRGKIDFQTFAFAMDDAFGEHAKEANKTFTGALGNMKAALSRVGEIFASPIINKTNTLFISLTERIDEFKNKLKSIKVPRTLEEIKKQYGDITLNAAAYDAMLKSMGDRTVTFGDHFAGMWQSGIDAFSAMIKSVDIGWFDKIVEKVDSVTVKIKEFFDLIKEIYGESAEEAADAINDATQTLLVSAEEAQAAKDIILKGMYGSGDARKAALTEMFGGGKEGEQHAKNVQAYVDSIIAADWDYEKATIKVAETNEKLVDSEKDIERENKKARIKETIDNITGTLSNLWKVAKNLGQAAIKIISPIITAFGEVFKIDFGSITGGVSSFSETLVKLSEKLIISDDTADKIKDTFVKFFGVVDKGLGYVKRGIELFENFAKSIAESETADTITGILTGLYDTIGSFFTLDAEGKKKNPISSFLTSITDAIDEFTTGSDDSPSKLTTFVNGILSSITSINWGDAAKIGGAAFAVSTIIKFVLAIKSLGTIITKIANIPASISSFFSSVGGAVSKAASAYTLLAAAKAIVVVAAAIVVLSQIPEDKLYRAIGVIIVIVAVIKYMMKAATQLGQADSTFKGMIASAKSAFAMVKTLYSVATLIAAFAAAVTIMSVGLAIIAKSDAANGEAFLTLIGIMSALTLVVYAMTKIVSNINPKQLMKFPAIFTSISVMFAAVGAAVLMMSGALFVISLIPTDAFGMIITILGAMFVGMALIIKMATDSKSSRLLTAAASIAAIGGAMSAIMLSIAGACAIIASAMSLLSASGTDPTEYILTFVGIISALFLAVVGLTEMANRIKNFATVAITMLAMSVTITAIGGSVLMISAALALISKTAGEDVGSALSILAVIFGGFITLMYMTTVLKPAQLLASAVMFIGVASAALILSVAISALSRLGDSENMLAAAGSLVVALIGLGIAITIASASLGKAKNSAVTVIGGILMMSVAIAVIAAAISKIGDTKHLLGATISLIGVMLAIGVVIGILAAVGKKSEGSSNSLLSAGAAFLMISASMLVLAFAIEKMAEVLNGPEVVGALIAMGVFVVLIGGLAIAAALIPGAALAFEAVGKAFLYAGIGAALVGAGILLVCTGIKLLAPAIGVLAISLSAFFTVLENHKATAIAVGVVTLVIIAGIIVAIMKLSPVIEAIANTISAVASRIGTTLKNGQNSLHNWISNLSTKGKAALVAMITTLCAAILKASPQVLNTVGQLIIKLLAFLGSIAGDVAMGLLDFLINLINGLADAIRANSARIAAALWGVVIALADVLWQIIGELVAMVVGAFSESAGNKVREFFGGTSEELNRMALEQRKLAEESDQAKRDLINDYKGVADEAEDAANRSVVSFDAISNAFHKNSESQKSDLASLKEEYADLPGYAYDAILRSKQAQSKAASTGGNPLDMMNPEEMMKQFGGDASYDGSGLLNPDIAQESGTTFTMTEAEAISENSDQIYDATTENTDSAQQAIIDSKEGTKKTVQENFNDPFQLQIRSGRGNSQMAVEYVVDGMIKAMDDKNESYAAAAVRLAKAGNRAFEKENKIDSPSKLYYQNGAYIVQGLINGISNNMNGAESTMENLSDKILVAFGDPFDHISKIATGELVPDTRIRPVFDDSGLRSGASSVNSMLARQTVSVSGFSGKLAADIGSLDRTNADVVAELQALREDMEYMTEEMTNMQIVMDTGALVGSTVGAYDDALGRRAVYGERGN